MKKTIIKAEYLKPALRKLQHAVAKNPTIPVISNLFLRVEGNSAELITTDLEITIWEVLECETSGDSFEMLIPFEYFQRIVGLSSQLQIQIESLSIRKGRIVTEHDIYELNSLEKIDDFPKIPVVPRKHEIKLDENFISHLHSAMLTVIKDDQRPALTRACLDIKKNELVIVSSDTHSLFSYTIPIESPEPDRLLISPRVAKAMANFSAIELTWHDKHLAFKSDKTTIIVTRQAEKYPNYQAVIPSHPANLLIYRLAFMNAIERAALANADQITIRFSKPDKLLKLISDNHDLHRKSQIEVAGEYTGEAEYVTFNPQKLLIVLSQVDYETINLHIQDHQRGVLISSELDKNYLGMIMPLLITL